LLVGNLFSSLRITTSVPRVHDDGAIILVILVAARYHDGFRASPFRATDARLEGTMNTSLVCRSTTVEVGSGGDVRKITNH
jgi:hypothetical protein